MLQVAVLPGLLTAVNRLQQSVEVDNAVLVEEPSVYCIPPSSIFWLCFQKIMLTENDIW